MRAVGSPRHGFLADEPRWIEPSPLTMSSRPKVNSSSRATGSDASALHVRPERDAAEATDQVAEDLLRMLGLPADEAQEICQRPLPDVAAMARWGSAAR
jgi:hypothetical protein